MKSKMNKLNFSTYVFFLSGGFKGRKTMKNKPGTAKVGAISEAQKAQVFKIVRWRPFGLFETPVCCKIRKQN